MTTRDHPSNTLKEKEIYPSVESPEVLLTYALHAEMPFPGKQNLSHLMRQAPGTLS